MPTRTRTPCAARWRNAGPGSSTRPTRGPSPGTPWPIRKATSSAWAEAGGWPWRRAAPAGCTGGTASRLVRVSTATLPGQVSDLFDPTRWRVVEGFDFEDITYHRQVERDADGRILRDLPAVRIAFDRPEVRNAFRPGTVDELFRAMDHARMTSDVAAVLLTGNGPSPKDGGHSFCSGGDQRIRGRDGYRYAEGDTAESVDPARAGRLHILEVQRL